MATTITAAPATEMPEWTGSFLGFDLGGWGIVAWAAAGALVLYLLLGWARRRFGRIKRRLVALAVVGTYGLGFPVGLDLGGFIGDHDVMRCDAVAVEDRSLANTPAKALCAVGDKVTGAFDLDQI